MSTMYDALRKAEAERKKAAGLTETSSLNSNDSIYNSDGGEKIKVLLLLIAVIAVFGIGIYRFITSKTISSPKKPETAQVAAQASISTVTTLAPLKAQRTPGTYGLDGIIDAGDDSLAIINGKLMKPEQTIDHLILKKISPKQVELLNTKDNSTVILKIN